MNQGDCSNVTVFSNWQNSSKQNLSLVQLTISFWIGMLKRPTLTKWLCKLLVQVENLRVGVSQNRTHIHGPLQTLPFPISMDEVGWYSTAAQGDSTMLLDTRLRCKIFDSTRSQSSWGGWAKTIGPHWSKSPSSSLWLDLEPNDDCFSQTILSFDPGSDNL